LPRRSIQQYESGLNVSAAIPYRIGDLLFSKSSRHNYYRSDPSMGVGHVSIVSGPNRIIFASTGGIYETDFQVIFDNGFCGARRIIRNLDDFYVFRIGTVNGQPREIKTSDDISFAILDRLR
jgi:hypothetical protein